jgi:sRNA-binding regulator protein Hfq
MLYQEIMRNRLSGKGVPHGKNGCFLASGGTVPWYDIYCAMVKALAKRQVIGSHAVDLADKKL